MRPSVGSAGDFGLWRASAAAIVFAVLVIGLVAGARPASADITGIDPSSATVVQGGAATATITLSQPVGGTCVSAPNPPDGVAVVGVPGCVLSSHRVSFVTTMVTEPGDYLIVFEERPLLGGGVIDNEVFRLTVLPLLTPPTTTPTTTTTTVATTTTTLAHVEVMPTTTTRGPITTSQPPADVTATPPSSTTTTSTTPVDTGGAPTTSSSTSSTTTLPDGDDDHIAGAGGAGSGTSPEAGLPPAPETMDEHRGGGIRAFLTPVLPAVVADVIVSPWHVLSAILGAALDTAGRVALLAGVLLVYSAYLVRRWVGSVEVAE